MRARNKFRDFSTSVEMTEKMDFIFNLGYSENLAKLELESVVGREVEKVADRQYKISFPDIKSMKEAADRFGGLVEVQLDGKVVWRHHFRDWFKRDRLKPFVDRKKGLLPPKIARILVNIATSNADLAGKTLLDPFCGSGTVLMEAGLVGLNIIGNDLDMVQLNGTKTNLDWLGLQAELLQSDAVKLSQQIKTPVNFIVTEPYMGRVTAREDRLPDLAKGLGKLYLGCLKDWHEILVPGGRVVMIFPVFEYKDKQYPTSTIVDDGHLLGYNIYTRGLMYFRPEARVKREIVILDKK